jgi:tRNA(Ile)-lysidine synthetase-like protein
MRITVGPGTYVVAVSGGVDSMVLLDILRRHPGLKLIVAHFDHGIREDSHHDRRLVQQIARKHGLPFVHHEGRLGTKASEAKARQARYDFLHKVRQASGARGIITAHHQDDVLETAILNLLRGTGRRGLTSLRSTDGILRPLLTYDKSRIREYAGNYQLVWREDATNSDNRFLRNYIRQVILPALTPGQKAQLLIVLENLQATNDQLDALITNLLHTQPALDRLERQWFVGLPHDVAGEVVHGWLRRHDIANLNRRTVERLITAMKTARRGKRIDVDRRHILTIGRHHLALQPVER